MFLMPDILAAASAYSFSVMTPVTNAISPVISLTATNSTSPKAALTAAVSNLSLAFTNSLYLAKRLVAHQTEILHAHRRYSSLHQRDSDAKQPGEAGEGATSAIPQAQTSFF